MALCGAGAGLEYMKRQAETEVEALSRRHTGSGIDDSPEKKRPLAEEVPPRYVDRDYTSCPIVQIWSRNLMRTSYWRITDATRTLQKIELVTMRIRSEKR